MSIVRFPIHSQSAALFGFRTNGTELYRLMEKLSSGLRINRASDDPAGLVISEQLRTQIASLNQEIENISLSIGKYQTTSSTVLSLRSSLTELRGLALAAADDGVSDETMRKSYDDSAQSLVASFNSTVETASYNGTEVLDGSPGSLVTILPMTEIDLSSAEAAEDSLARIDEAIHQVDEGLVSLGARQKFDLESRQASLEISRQNLISAESQIRDADIPDTFSRYVGSLIRQKAAIALQAHARVSSQMVLSLLDI